MKHDIDYEDGIAIDDPTVIYTTGHQATPLWQAIAQWRLQTGTERIDQDLAELRQRVAALEAWRRNHDG